MQIAELDMGIFFQSSSDGGCLLPSKNPLASKRTVHRNHGHLVCLLPPVLAAPFVYDGLAPLHAIATNGSNGQVKFGVVLNGALPTISAFRSSEVARWPQGAVVVMTAELPVSEPEVAFNVIVPAVVVDRTTAISLPLKAACDVPL